MSRLDIQRETIRSLFALSGNLCAFPGCTHELVSSSRTLVAQICHIEAANKGGQRFNPARSDEYLRSHQNLIVLCYRHHKETDDVAQYPVEHLLKMKAEHEAAQGRKQFKIDESSLYKIERDMALYWSELQRTNKEEHVAPDFAVEIKVGQSPSEIFQDLYAMVARINEYAEYLHDSDKSLNDEVRAHLTKIGYALSAYDAVEYYLNPFYKRGWEIHNLALPNSFTELSVAIMAAEVRFLEEYIKTNPADASARLRLEEIKAELIEAAKSTGYAD